MTYDSLVSDIEDYLDRTNTALIAQIPSFITLGEMRCAREVKNLGLKTSAVSTFTAGQAVYAKPVRWLEVISVNYGEGSTFTTVSRTAASGTRTLVLSEAHDFAVGDAVSVYNLGGTTYNGDFTITAITQFTIAYVSGSVTEATTADTGGTVTQPLNNRTALLPRSLEFCNEYWPDRSEVGTPKYYADYNYNNWLIVPTPTIAGPYEVVYFQQPEFLSDTNQQNWFTQYSRDLLLYACLLETAPYLKNDSRIGTWKDYYMQSASAIKKENAERINDGGVKRQEDQ